MTGCADREWTNLAGDFGQTKGQSAGQPAVPGNNFPGSWSCSRGNDERDQDPMVADARDQIVDFGGGITVDRQAETIGLEPVRGDGNRSRGV